MIIKCKFDVYLAGSMHGRLGREVLEERSAAKLQLKLCGLTWYDPAEDEEVPPNKIIDLKPNLRRMKWFVSKDDYHVDRCKVLLVLTGDKSSSGTGWEMGRMFYHCKRPIVVVAPKMYHRLLTNFTTVKASKIFETVEQAAKYIRRIK
jgi:nucleoside 2-deoxyribosyltransferase